MAAAINEPSEGWTFGALAPDTSRDLLDSGSLPYALDEPMSDSDETLFLTQSALDNDSNENIKLEDLEQRFPWTSMPNEIIELSDDDLVEIKTEPAKKKFDWKTMRENIVEISDSEEELPESKEPKPPMNENGLEEEAPAQIPGSSIEGDKKGQGVQFKEEQNETPYSWKRMRRGTIMIADDDDENDRIILDDGSTLELKKEQDQIPISWSEMDGQIIDLDSLEVNQPITKTSLLGNPMFRKCLASVQRPRISSDKMQKMQRVYAARVLGKPVATGAGVIFQPPDLTHPPHSKPTLNDDGIEWMTNAVIPDDPDPRAEFQKLKQAYKAKRKARKNTLGDDVEFKKAQKGETERIKRLAHDTAGNSEDSDKDEAEDSDDGLFLPEAQTRSGLSKRPFTAYEDDDDEDNEELINALISKPSAKFSRMDETNDKSDTSDRRSRAREYRKELAKEQRYNMMAGIEAVLLRDQMKQEMKAAKEVATQEKNSNKGRNKKAAKGAQLSTKRTKTGRMTNVGSLLTSNVYDDSNASLGQASLPVVTEKKKKEFLSSLIAHIPLEGKKEANQDRIDILKSSNLLLPRHCLPDGKGNWAMKGVNSSLFHYQVQGAAYMKTRELGAQSPFGGILADGMGLGKTVMTIATMVANRQTDPERPKCTLIVCSPALMTQWKRELKIHVDENTFKRIVCHHANTKFSGKGAEEEMQRADIILTTYGEVVRSYPKCHLPKDIKDSAAKEAWWTKEWDTNRDLLHRAHFYRVVLDEAQIIKTHTSQTSIACRALMAKHRWAISGTPIQNRLDELFPYFKFLRVQYTGSMAVFRQNFCLKDSDVCNKRLVSMISGIMIRRSHDMKLLGHKLVELPKNTQNTVSLKFNQVEQHIYDIVKMRCIRAINAASRQGSLDQESKMVIIMFQRLRQMVAHIFMVQEVLEKEMEVSDIKAIWSMIDTEVEDFNDNEKDMMRSLERMIAGKGTVTDEPDLGDLFANVEPEPTPTKVPKKSRSLVGRFAKLLRDLKRTSKWGELTEHTLCQLCGESPEDPYVTSCYHLFCKDCLTGLAIEAAAKDMDQTECFKCGHVFTESLSCNGLKELEVRDFSASVFQGKIKKTETEAKKKFKITMKYVDSDDKLLLSTKTAAVKEEIAASLREDPNMKIIVFSEWLMVMHLIGRVCQQEGWKCCHYNGKISQHMRDQSLNAFEADPNIKVLVASLKCGGTGLNLTAASKVICVDLWFNNCVEQQAFCRVHRIGQKKETFITRFKVEGTVDESLIEMQEEKKEIIGAALDDRSILSQLTLPELMRIFGPVSYDEESKPFIMVDDEAEIGGKKKRRSGQQPSA